jgi:arsenate reductase
MASIFHHIHPITFQNTCIFPSDFVITVCDHAQEVCPVFPFSTQRFHHNFSDPSKVVGTETEILAAFRQTRDAIKAYCQQFVLEQVASD